MLKQCTSFIAVLCVSVTINGQTTSLSVETVVSKLQSRYDRLNDFSADFHHTYTGGLLSTTDTERGVVHVKKPGRWRFNYAIPEEKSFISNGTSIYSYFPQDQQVIISQLPTTPGATTPALFLSGVGSLHRDFTTEVLNPVDSDSRSLILRLTPIAANANYEFLILTLDPETFDIEVMATTDFQGGVSTYTFSNLMENPGLSDTVFEFDIPQDVDVITDDSFTR
jgi:outer membrane lipoprotein carrier protein